MQQSANFSGELSNIYGKTSRPVNSYTQLFSNTKTASESLQKRSEREISQAIKLSGHAFSEAKKTSSLNPSFSAKQGHLEKAKGRGLDKSE